MAEKITMTSAGLQVPNQPIIPFIDGDGTGPDIWNASLRVFDAAVDKAYGSDRKIAWKKVEAGEASFQATGEWLPDATVEAFREYMVGIKGPLTTPVAGGIRSLNVALRQRLDLYVCLRPVRYFEGVPSPLRHPERTDMVIFRENTEDIYAGIEFEHGTDDADRFKRILKDEFPEHYAKLRFPNTAGFGIKPVSEEGTHRLVRAAIDYALANDKASVTLVHKGNIMKFTEGAFRDWGYEFARNAYGANDYQGGPWQVIDRGGQRLIIKDVIADAFLQQILTRPEEYDVIATLNLNGDYISDALAACVGGIGIAPGGNVNYDTGISIFEATHGTAPKYADQDKVNPGSLILSGEMMFRQMGWQEAADLIISGVKGAISAKTVTYDFHRQMQGATLLKCSEFGTAVIEHM